MQPWMIDQKRKREDEKKRIPLHIPLPLVEKALTDSKEPNNSSDERGMVVIDYTI